MNLDPELLKQLIESFNTELEEHLIAITNGLLALEKNNLTENETHSMIETIFRSAHNIKGTSRSLGINDLSDIAHRIESLFDAIQKKTSPITPETITTCLNAVDKMRTAFSNFVDINQQGTKKIKRRSASHNDSHEHDMIRVPIHQITKISTLIEEVQVNKIALSEYYSELSKLVSQTNLIPSLWKQLSAILNKYSDIEESSNFNQLSNLINDHITHIKQTTHNVHKNMRKNIDELSILSHSLQEEVSVMRMIPIENLLCTFPRYVRDLSLELNKQVELSIRGNEIKIDKAILEKLKDPLIHMIRNSIDHGIEPPSVRKRMGKSETGHIDISIKKEEGYIQIKITDDGAGIDIKKIEKIAETKNICNSSDLETMNSEDKINLIFHSGFSTKENISDVSGRGVGLDVVKSNIDELNGFISVSTDLGKSTTFTLNVPVSIASGRGLLIKSGGENFVIPTSSIEHILQMNIDEIIQVQGKQAIILKKRTIPLRPLSDVLFLKNYPISDKIVSIVVLQKESRAIALLVDEIVGEREMIIKPFTNTMAKLACVAGGTLLDNNQLVIVLESGGLIKKALSESNPSFSITLDKNPVKKVEKPRILVVDDSITTRTLEKTVLESKNYEVTLAVNGKEAWDILQHNTFSLMITDISMPLMDGFTLTEQVKKSKTLRELPVIIVTSLGSDAEKKRGVEVGADGYIVKSEFESGALLNMVAQFV